MVLMYGVGMQSLWFDMTYSYFVGSMNYVNTIQYNTIQYNTMQRVCCWLKTKKSLWWRSPDRPWCVLPLLICELSFLMSCLDHGYNFHLCSPYTCLNKYLSNHVLITARKKQFHVNSFMLTDLCDMYYSLQFNTVIYLYSTHNNLVLNWSRC